MDMLPKRLIVMNLRHPEALQVLRIRHLLVNMQASSTNHSHPEAMKALFCHQRLPSKKTWTLSQRIEVLCADPWSYHRIFKIETTMSDCEYISFLYDY